MKWLQCRYVLLERSGWGSNEIDIFVSKRAAAQLHTIKIPFAVQISFKERAGHMLVSIDGLLYQRYPLSEKQLQS